MLTVQEFQELKDILDGLLCCFASGVLFCDGCLAVAEMKALLVLLDIGQILFGHQSALGASLLQDVVAVSH